MSVLFSTWRSIWHFHRVLASILILEYAFTFTIVLISSGMLVSRVAAITQESGVQEDGLYVVSGEGIGRPLHRPELLEAGARFRALAGQGDVAFASSVPFYGLGSHSVPITAADDPDQANLLQAEAYQGDENFTTVLGLRILQGRNFRPDDIVLRYGDSSHLIMLSEALAQRIFHGEACVGKQVVVGGQTYTVTGVFSPLAAPIFAGEARTGLTLLLPEFPSDDLILVRYDGNLAELQNVINGLNSQPGERWQAEPYRSVRSSYFATDRQVVMALVVVTGIVFVIALCGILGLTNYWVSRRRRQIATRRALGATQRDIRMHFLGESGLLVTIGVLLGLVLDVMFRAAFGDIQLEIGLGALGAAAGAMLLLGAIVVNASLRRWLRMNPVELMRSL